MSLGTIAIIRAAGAMPSAPTFFDRISFTGDTSYPTGGTPGFKALLRAKSLDQRAPIAVITEAAGVYQASYDVDADKLVVRDGAGAEVANTTNLSGTTFKLVVLSQ